MPIYILHFELRKGEIYSPGDIKKFSNSDILDHYKILYSCSTKKGSSVGPIINPSNYKVIGFHKGYDPTTRLNSGIIIKSQIL